MTALMEPTDTDAAVRRDALAERLFGSLLGGMELLSVQLGLSLGLYQALRDAGTTTAAEFAARAGIDSRYAREWLEQQAVCDIVEVTAASDDADARRYALPAGHAEALLDVVSPGYIAAAAPSLLGLAKVIDDVAAAYRTGGGVAYADFGVEIREGIGGFNRPMFTNDLANEWLQALPDVWERLQAGEPVRILDLGCGTGWSTIALAGASPTVTVTGVDLDEASIAQARRNAAAAGVTDRVRFELADGAAFDGEDGYDLACVFEALHDMGDPVGALGQVRAKLRPGAPLLVGDERVADSFTAPGDEIERFMYGWSVLHCLPATLAESPKVANGTVLRAATVQEWGNDAGFARVEVLPIANDFWRFYRLDS